MVITFRKCKNSDLRQLAEIAIQTFRESFATHNTEENMLQYIEAAFNDDKLLSELGSPYIDYFFGYENKNCVGYLKINQAPWQTDINDPDSLELERIYVRKPYQNKGYGVDFLHKVIAECKARKLKYIWLGVWEHNTGAFKFYKRNGFEKYDEHSFNLGAEKQIDYLMKLDL